MNEQISPEDLYEAVKNLGKNSHARTIVLEAIINAEKHLLEQGFDPREAITGPIVDTLFSTSERLSKTTDSGLNYTYLYKSKIAREICMAPPQCSNHIWEPQTTKLLRLLSQYSSNAIVGGAYSGDQALFIAQNLKSRNAGECHAFEPNDDQRAMLVENATNNQLDNIISQPVGLWDEDNCSIKLVGFDSFAHPEIAHKNEDNSFPTTTIDSYCESSHLDEVGLIMLDIEGAELRALKGASKLLSMEPGKAPNIVFEVHRHYVDWSNGLENTDIVLFLQQHGYSVFSIRDFNSSVDMKNCPIEIIEPSATYIDGPAHGFNMLAVKDTQIVNNEHFRPMSNVSPKLLWHRDPSLHLPEELKLKN